MTDLETIIGLEIHLQLKTKSKMFCSCPNVDSASDETEPNTAICPVCTGHPGTLPVPNREAFRLGILLAHAFKSSINSESHFDRKNYFYPDLPKGYQITQHYVPLAHGGHIIVPSDPARTVYLDRLHLEEDAGKNFHVGGDTLVDFNRAGVPLVEIVTKPDLRSPAEARIFLQELRLMARFAGASDADMEKGHLRCDANISLRPRGSESLYAKTEVKNMNSFKAVEKALLYEVERQKKLWDAGTPPTAGETRGWNEKTGTTVAQRSKEASDDYRYFPEPDIPPITVLESDVATITSTLPEMPHEKRARFTELYALTLPEADILVTSGKDIAGFFEEVISELKNWLYDVHGHTGGSREEVWITNKRKAVKLLHSWLTTELFKHMRGEGKTIAQIRINPENFAELIALIYEGKVSSSGAQTVLERMYYEGDDPHYIAERDGLLQVDDVEEIRTFVRSVIASFPDQVAQYKAGKQGVLQFLIGHVMKISKGRANPEIVQKMLLEELGMA